MDPQAKKIKVTNQSLSFSELESFDEAVEAELSRIRYKYGLFNSTHELYAILLEEVEEFWESVKQNKADAAELVQVAAIAKAGAYWMALKSKID